MARDNQPKHRQLARSRARLARGHASRAGLPSFLIVCEGRETEPNYLRGFCDAELINAANADIQRGNAATDPVALVRRARDLFEADRDYDYVVVVCDDAPNLAEAAELAAKPMRHADGKRRVHVELVVSRPCIEFWLLLHFEYSTRAFLNAAEAVNALRRHVTDYDKADRRIFGKVSAGVERAIGHAQRLKLDLAASGAHSPDSDMPRLLTMLREASRRETGR